MQIISMSFLKYPVDILVLFPFLYKNRIQLKRLILDLLKIDLCRTDFVTMPTGWSSVEDNTTACKRSFEIQR